MYTIKYLGKFNLEHFYWETVLCESVWEMGAYIQNKGKTGDRRAVHPCSRLLQGMQK